MSAPVDEAARAAGELLDGILAGRHADFALLHRPQSGPAGRIEVLVGTGDAVARLADIPLADAPTADAPTPDAPTADAPTADALPAREAASPHEVLAFVPYRRLAERGFAVVDDGAPVLVLKVAGQASAPVQALLDRLPDVRTDPVGGAFDLDDEAYAELVRRVVAEEIGTGRGANFVLRRSFVAEVPGWSPASALSVFRRLMERERGAYWTFAACVGGRTFVGATPERHVSVDGGLAVMNPISGTYRYPAEGPTTAGVLSFLADRKEADELSMVVDEELKMMARISDAPVRVRGPHLVEMAGLAHTACTVEGRTGADVRDILRETLFAPTVVGSPLESAAEVVRRFEPHGRGYYSGVAALIGRDAGGGRALDSSILIRTAVVEPGGRLTLGVGATVVRDSDPHAEAAETRAKAAGMLAALRGDGRGTAAPPGAPSGGGPLARQPEVQAALRGRRGALSAFWLDPDAHQDFAAPELVGRSVLVVDAEDTFTALWAQQIRACGPTVTVRRFDEPCEPGEPGEVGELGEPGGYDLVVLGPGPGDPRRTRDPKIDRLRAMTRRLLEDGRPFLSVCLSHQVLCGLLGLPLVRKERPDQGVQKEIDLFGRPERVGFYNTFAARAPGSGLLLPRGVPGGVEVCRDEATGQVHALRGPGFRSVQFHPESVLTANGPRIVAELLGGLLTDSTTRPHRELAAVG